MLLSIVSIVVRECVMVTRINEERPAAAVAANANLTTIAPTADEDNASAPAEATPLLTVQALRNGLKN